MLLAKYLNDVDVKKILLIPKLLKFYYFTENVVKTTDKTDLLYYNADITS